MADPPEDEEAVRAKLKELQVYVPFIRTLIDNAIKTKISSPSVIKKMRHLLFVLETKSKL
jgi:hypothetical protein